MKTNLEFTFKNYQTKYATQKLNEKLLFLTNDRKKIKKNSFILRKITNNTISKLIKNSILINFKNVINGQIFFSEFDNCIKKFLKQQSAIEKKKLLYKTLVIKLNNKIYFPKKVLLLDLITYKENLIIFYCNSIISLKTFLKN